VKIEPLRPKAAIYETLACAAVGQQILRLTLFSTHFSVNCHKVDVKGSQLGMKETSLYFFMLRVVEVVRYGSLLARRKYNFL
jgi:hypothetical protein